MEADTDCTTDNNGGFSSKCWNGYEITAGSFQTLTFRFMPNSDSNRYNSGDSELVWAITFDEDTENIKNEDFTFKGASQISAVLCASVATIALFTF